MSVGLDTPESRVEMQLSCYHYSSRPAMPQTVLGEKATSLSKLVIRIDEEESHKGHRRSSLTHPCTS